jgi:tetratricopeptide (TPR) repeat protein
MLSRSLSRALIALGVLAALPPVTGAQQAPASTEPARPALPSGLDPNEAGSYVLFARQYLESEPAKALASVYWASRLDPMNAEALMLRWRATWMTSPKLRKQLERRKPDAADLASPERIDSLYWRAMLRDPFIIATGGGSAGFMPPMDIVRRYLKKHPDEVGLWIYLGALYHRQHEFDSTLATVRRGMEALDRIEQRGFRPVYESRAMFHYAIGKTEFALGRHDAARDAFQKALTDDLAFYPAHAALGTLAWTVNRDLNTAIAEFDLAIELFRDDGVVYYDYGTILLKNERWEDALARFDRAVALEPWFPDAHHNRGIALDRLGRHAEAVAAYRQFVSLAPRRLSAQIDKVHGRIATLSAPASDSLR